MVILQLLFSLGLFGLIGTGLYWLGIVLGVGEEVEQEFIDSDPRI
jgi:hypothetical protein